MQKDFVFCNCLEHDVIFLCVCFVHSPSVDTPLTAAARQLIHKQSRNRHIMSTNLWPGCSIFWSYGLFFQNTTSGSEAVTPEYQITELKQQQHTHTNTHTHTLAHHWMAVWPWDAEVQVCLWLQWLPQTYHHYGWAGRHDTLVSPLIRQDWCTSHQYWNTQLYSLLKTHHFCVFWAFCSHKGGSLFHENKAT